MKTTQSLLAMALALCMAGGAMADNGATQKENIDYAAASTMTPAEQAGAKEPEGQPQPQTQQAQDDKAAKDSPWMSAQCVQRIKSGLQRDGESGLLKDDKIIKAVCDCAEKKNEKLMAETLDDNFINLEEAEQNRILKSINKKAFMGCVSELTK